KPAPVRSRTDCLASPRRRSSIATHDSLSQLGWPGAHGLLSVADPGEPTSLPTSRRSVRRGASAAPPLHRARRLAAILPKILREGGFGERCPSSSQFPASRRFFRRIFASAETVTARRGCDAVAGSASPDVQPPPD